MPPTPRILRVRITAKDRKTLATLPFEKLDTGCTGGVRDQPDGSVAVEALVEESVLKSVRARRSLRVEVLADATEIGVQRQKDVGKGNRFTGEDPVPRGFGEKVRDERSR